MASINMVPSSGVRDHNGSTTGVDRLPEEMNDMKIRDDKVTGDFPLPYLLCNFYC